MTKRYLLLLVLIALGLVAWVSIPSDLSADSSSYVQETRNFNTVSRDPLLSSDPAQQIWVDSVYRALTLEQRIGQLFMIDVFSEKQGEHIANAKRLVSNFGVGGIIYSKGGPQRQHKLNSEMQDLAQVPLLIAMDAEWGPAMRLDSTFAFPWNMTLGALRNDQLVKEVGYRIGEHNRRLGVHMNFAPVVDINTNPKNPIIGNRSFGEDRDNVGAKGVALMQGMLQAGVLGSAKHFPGHGDTATDSHKTLPTIEFDKARIDSVELEPFRQLIDNGVASIMVAHMHIPALDSRTGIPSSISENVVQDLLIDELGFKGLIFTDALNMKGASNYTSPGDIDLAAFLAGNDVMLISENVPVAIKKFKAAYQDGRISEERLARSVRKILNAKWLSRQPAVSSYRLTEDLNRRVDSITYQKVATQAITVVKNENDLLPFKNLATRKVAYLQLGGEDGTHFYDRLSRYTDVHRITAKTLAKVIAELEDYNTVIIGVHKSNANPWKSYKLSTKDLNWLQEVARRHEVVLDVFASPYAINQLTSFENIESIVISYQNSPMFMEASASALFGATTIHGQLPVTAGPFPALSGLRIDAIDRLGYAIPEQVGLHSYQLARVDSMASNIVNRGVTPGLQLLVAREGKIVLDKSYGYHTGNKARPVRWDDVYDLASLTKILSSLPLIMQLEEDGVFNLDAPISRYLPELAASNKSQLTLKQMLSHYAQLRPWIPFYLHTMDTVTNRPDVQYYRSTAQGPFQTKVAKNMFIRDDARNRMWDSIVSSPLRERKEYKYSDLPYYITQRMLEGHYNRPIAELANSNVYQGLGMSRTGYHPREWTSAATIVPTEKDDYWRNQLVHGYVHDQGAAMLGGAGGHAGLFGNATDIAKLMQAYLQDGRYGDVQLIQPETMDKFNTRYYQSDEVRRGVGFDKPQLDEVGPTCGCVSDSSFGHSGFTGTYTWADPETELIFVFVANRVYPDASNRTLITENIRTDMQQMIQDAIMQPL